MAIISRVMRRWNLIGYFLTFIGLVFFPPFCPSYVITLMTSVLIYSLFASSVNILFGYTGLVSIGQATFWGVAGYSVGILSTLGIIQNAYLLVLISLLMVTLLSGIMGILVLRTRGVYFLMITFALGHAVYCIAAFTLSNLTGGIDGLTGIIRPNLGLPFSLMNNLNFYYFVLFVFSVCLVFIYLIVKSPFGHSLVGIRENEHRMLALGYNTWLYKYTSYIISAIFAGIAGILYIYFDCYISPSELDWIWSADSVMMVIIGGSGTLHGPILGALVFTGLRYVLSIYTDHSTIIIGVLFIFVVLFVHGGIAGLPAQIRKLIYGSIKN